MEQQMMVLLEQLLRGQQAMAGWVGEISRWSADEGRTFQWTKYHSIHADL
jgi:hypothetical protein